MGDWKDNPVPPPVMCLRPTSTGLQEGYEATRPVLPAQVVVRIGGVPGLSGQVVRRVSTHPGRTPVSRSPVRGTRPHTPSSHAGVCVYEGRVQGRGVKVFWG